MSASAKASVRRAALIAAVALSLLVILLALPPVQLRLARALAGMIDGVELDLGYLWAGPRGIELKDMHFEAAAAGLGIDIAEATVDFATLSSLIGLRLDVEAATLRDVAIRVDPVARPPVAQETNPPAFDGLKPMARLPRRLNVARLEAAGNLSLRSTNQLDVSGPWELSATSLARNATAEMNLSATLSADRLGETLAAATISATSSAELDASARVSAFTFATEIQPLDDRPGLRANVTARLDENAERYEAEIDEQTGNRLAGLTISLEPGGDLDAAWEANLTPGVVAAFARGRSIADLSGRSTGRVRLNLNADSAQIQSSINVHGEGWDAFDPRLGEIGALEVGLELEGTVEPGLATARTLGFTIASAERGEMLRIDAVQPLGYEIGNWLVDAETWGEPALRIQASRLPLRWLRRFGAATSFEEGEISGAIELVRQEERRTELVVTEPLRAAGVQIAPVQGVSVPAFDVDLVPHVVLANGALEGEIEELTITAATGLDVLFRGQVHTSQSDWPLTDFEGSVAAHVPALQRIMPQLDRVRGTTHLQLDFDTLVLEIAAASLGADSVDGHELFAADLSGQEPLHVQLPQFAADWDDFEAQSASLRLDRVPLDWVSPYIPELEFRGGEVSGQLRVGAIVGRGLLLQSDEPLIIANVLPIYRGMAARDTWSASVRPRVQLSTARSSIALEDLVVETRTGNALRADMTLDVPANSNRIAIDLTIDADISEIASLSGLRVSTLHWRQEGEIDTAMQHLTLESFELDIKDMTNQDILLLESLQPFAITAEPFAVAAETGSAAVLRAVVSPIRLERLLPNIFGLDLEGALPEGEFFGRVDPSGSLVLATDGPLTFRDVTVRWGEATLLDRVTTAVQYDVSYSAGGLEARSVDLTATGSDGRTLLHAASEVAAPLSGVRLLDRASIDLEANLEPLARQPVLADLPRFSDGTAVVSLEIVNGAESSVSLSATLRDAATALGSIPNVDLAFEAAGIRGQRFDLRLPLRLESQEYGVSDLRLDGVLSTTDDGSIDLEAALTGESLAIGDLQTFIDLFVPRQQENATDEPRRLAPLSEETLSAIAKLRAERDDIPFWTGHLLGRTRVDLGRITFPSFSVDDVSGRLEFTENEATLTDLNASLLGAHLDAAARVDFDPARAKPYALDFHASIDDIDVKNLFLAVSPDSIPTAEGRFELSSTLTGSGFNALDLGLSTLGEIRLTGRDGIFRGLAPHAGTGSTAARVIGVLTFSRELRAVGRLLDRLGEIQFQEAEFLLERNTLDRVDLSSLLVRSPQMRIAASGGLALAPQRPLLLSPLDVAAEISARDDIATLFDGMGLLEDDTDDAGYRRLTKIVHVGGTPIEPDVSEFWGLLEEGADNARGAFRASLRALNRRLEAGRE
jgi:hypothetical protein